MEKWNLMRIISKRNEFVAYAIAALKVKYLFFEMLKRGDKVFTPMI